MWPGSANWLAVVHSNSTPERSLNWQAVLVHDDLRIPRASTESLNTICLLTVSCLDVNRAFRHTSWINAEYNLFGEYIYTSTISTVKLNITRKSYQIYVDHSQLSNNILKGYANYICSLNNRNASWLGAIWRGTEMSIWNSPRATAPFTIDRSDSSCAWPQSRPSGSSCMAWAKQPGQGSPFKFQSLNSNCIHTTWWNLNIHILIDT